MGTYTCIHDGYTIQQSNTVIILVKIIIIHDHYNVYNVCKLCRSLCITYLLYQNPILSSPSSKNCLYILINFAVKASR